MIVETIQHATTETIVSYQREFEWNDTPGAGFGFSCDEHGTLSPELPAEARANYEKHKADPRLTDKGIKKLVTTYRHPKIARCECGGEVYLDGFTCGCSGCRRLYNWAGQELAPVEQWGEETGEHWTDIINIP